ncbi:MAG TPA: helix-turn-helix domain-containing protein [Accumulibacter sp.]|nr:helix-turn-helix domain-containing protein [Accumulibacter sp.]
MILRSDTAASKFKDQMTRLAAAKRQRETVSMRMRSRTTTQTATPRAPADAEAKPQKTSGASKGGSLHADAKVCRPSNGAETTVDASNAPLLTVKEVAIRLNMSERQVRRWVGSGDLPTVRPGHAVRIKEEELQRFIRRHEK